MNDSLFVWSIRGSDTLRRHHHRHAVWSGNIVEEQHLAAAMAHRRATASIMPLRFFLLCTAYIRSFGMTHTSGISFIVTLPIVCCDARRAVVNQQ
jgi:hypothetical protein